MTNPTVPVIVIVEDEVIVAMMLERLLGRLFPAYAIEVFHDAPVALARIAVPLVQLVISNLNLPSMDGVQLLAAIKARWPTIRVILISGLDMASLQQRLGRHQADGILTKPFGRDELEAVVRAALA